MRPYADTNFFSRLYLFGPSTGSIKELLDEAERKESAPLPVTWLHRIETLNAFQLFVFSGKQRGHLRITREQAAAAHALFQADLREATFLQPAHIDFDDLERQFEEVSLRHTAKQGFRAYDILHVASALLLRCDTFWSFDSKACMLASLEGMAISEFPKS